MFKRIIIFATCCIQILMMKSLLEVVDIRRFTSSEPNYIAYMIESAGGLQNINSDAEKLFDIYYKSSKNWIVYNNESDKEKFPYLLSIARFIAISNSGHLPKYIEVTYGYRFLPGVFVIFDPREKASEDLTKKDPNLVKVLENIYWYKYRDGG